LADNRNAIKNTAILLPFVTDLVRAEMQMGRLSVMGRTLAAQHGVRVPTAEEVEDL